MYRLLAIAKYDDRYVIPTGHSEAAHNLEGIGTDCPLNSDGGPGMMHLPEQDMGMAAAGPIQTRPTESGRINLLNWDGRGRPRGLFPSRPAAST
jgi:nitrate reductase beta subunit